VYVTKAGSNAKRMHQASIDSYLGLIRANRTRSLRGVMDLTYDRVYDDFAAIGDPDQCVEKLRSLQQMYQPQEIMCWFNTGGLLPHEEVAKSMKLFAEEVMPQLR